MKTKLSMCAAIVVAGFLSACAQQEEPPIMIKPEPVYDKYGNVVHTGYATKSECLEHHEAHHCMGLPE